MRALLPSVWLLGAALYTGSILSLLHPFSGDEDWPAPPPLRESVVAKAPPEVTIQALDAGGSQLLLAALPAKAKAERRNEWVQVGAYTTVARSRPSAEAHPLEAYAAGHAFRVLAREGRFVRVQDLGNGHFGWIEASALVPFNGGYRLRQTPAAAPLVAAAEPSVQAAEPLVTLEAAPQMPESGPVPAVKSRLAAAKKPPRDVLGLRSNTQAVAGFETSERGWFRKKRGVQRVALGGEGGMTAMIDRAIRGF